MDASLNLVFTVFLTLTKTHVQLTVVGFHVMSPLLQQQRALNLLRKSAPISCALLLFIKPKRGQILIWSPAKDAGLSWVMGRGPRVKEASVRGVTELQQRVEQQFG